MDLLRRLFASGPIPHCKNRTGGGAHAAIMTLLGYALDRGATSGSSRAPRSLMTNARQAETHNLRCSKSHCDYVEIDPEKQLITTNSTRNKFQFKDKVLCGHTLLFLSKPPPCLDAQWRKMPT